jgi:hypothetical protein
MTCMEEEGRSRKKDGGRGRSQGETHWSGVENSMAALKALPQAQLPCSSPPPGHDIPLVGHPQAMPQPCCYLSSIAHVGQQ